MVKIGVRMSYVRISADVCRHIRVLLVWRGMGCEGWRGPPRTSALVRGGDRVELWRDRLKKRQKTVESQAEQKNSSVSGLYLVKIRYNSLRINDWARRVHV